MDSFTKLSGSSAISPVTENVWKVEKKKEVDDRRQSKKGRRDLPEKKSGKSKEVRKENDELIDETGLDSGEEVFYNVIKPGKRKSIKVDVVI